MNAHNPFRSRLQINAFPRVLLSALFLFSLPIFIQGLHASGLPQDQPPKTSGGQNGTHKGKKNAAKKKVDEGATGEASAAAGGQGQSAGDQAAAGGQGQGQGTDGTGSSRTQDSKDEDSKNPAKSPVLEKIDAKLRYIMLALAGLGALTGIASFLYWLFSKKQIDRVLSAKITSLNLQPARNKEDLNQLQQAWKQELELLEKKLDSLAETVTSKKDIHTIAEQQSALQNELSALHESVKRGDSEVLERTHDALAKLETRVHAIEQEDMESYFDKWKGQDLESKLQSVAVQVFKDFTGNPENEKTVRESVTVLKKVLETAGPWFDAIGTCIKAVPATPGDGAWSEFSIRFQKYCESGADLRRRVQQAIEQSDLRQEPAGVAGNLSFFDVASGRSARSISHDYEDRLCARMQRLQQAAADAAQQWQVLRDELMKLLDHLDATRSASGQPPQVRQLQAQLSSTLRPLKFQEIPVETNSTVFDPSLHENIAGGAVARPELPENTIVRLERRGFFYEGKVLRRALVAVSSRG